MTLISHVIAIGGFAAIGDFAISARQMPLAS
jgi:hypothetical protein